MATDSSNSKKESQQDDDVAISDKIYLRICTQSSHGRVVDLLASNLQKTVMTTSSIAITEKHFEKAKQLLINFISSLA